MISSNMYFNYYAYKNMYFHFMHFKSTFIETLYMQLTDCHVLCKNHQTICLLVRSLYNLSIVYVIQSFVYMHSVWVRTSNFVEIKKKYILLHPCFGIYCTIHSIYRRRAHGAI
jgi:hypothetical protein